ncbi:MAG: hypothetical protein WD558_02545 [Pseudomonadales bacterium]
MVELTAMPLWWATALTVLLFIGIGVGTWTLSREKSFSDAPDQSRWRDLRIWASVLVVVQLAIYLMFS